MGTRRQQRRGHRRPRPVPGYLGRCPQRRYPRRRHHLSPVLGLGWLGDPRRHLPGPVSAVADASRGHLFQAGLPLPRHLLRLNAARGRLDVRDPWRLAGRRPVDQQPGRDGRRLHRSQRYPGRRRRHPRLFDGVHDLHGPPVAHHRVPDDRNLHAHGRCRRRRRRPGGGRQLPSGRPHNHVADPRGRGHAHGRLGAHDGDRDGRQGRGSRGRDSLRPRPDFADARRRLHGHGPHEPARLLRLRGRQARVPHGYWPHDHPGDRGLVPVRGDRRALVGYCCVPGRDDLPSHAGHHRRRVGLPREPLRGSSGPAALLRVVPGGRHRGRYRRIRCPVPDGHPHGYFLDPGTHGYRRCQARHRLDDHRRRVPGIPALRFSTRIRDDDAPPPDPLARPHLCGEHPGSVFYADR